MSAEYRVEKAPVKSASVSPLTRLAMKVGMEPEALRSTLMATVMPQDGRTKVTPEAFGAFLLVAENYDLDPLRKQIYAFPHRGGIVPVVGVDGWYALMNAHAQFDGVEYEDKEDAEGQIVSVTAKIWRKDRGHPMAITEYLSECKGTTEPWKKWPRRMLRHKATIQAARAAFGISGVYEPDEAERMRDASFVMNEETGGGQSPYTAEAAYREIAKLPGATVEKERDKPAAASGTTDSGGRLEPADAAPKAPVASPTHADLKTPPEAEVSYGGAALPLGVDEGTADFFLDAGESGHAPTTPQITHSLPEITQSPIEQQASEPTAHTDPATIAEAGRGTAASEEWVLAGRTRLTVGPRKGVTIDEIASTPEGLQYLSLQRGRVRNRLVAEALETYLSAGEIRYELDRLEGN